MGYFTERNDMRKPINKSSNIDPEKYDIILGCCERYYDYIAWRFPEECEDGCGVCGIDIWKLAKEIKYEIPDLYIGDSGKISTPCVYHNIFSGENQVDEYNQYALLDFVEFLWINMRDVNKNEYHSFFKHYHYIKKETRSIVGIFQDDINKIFKKLGLLYILNEKGKVERIVENDVVTNEVINSVLAVKEKGVRELLQEAVEKHQSHDPKEIRDAVDKIWDAFERLKTYYTNLDKMKSAEKIVEDISNGEKEYIDFFNEEFRKLTKIGNEFRIRHHETDKIEITDLSYYDYFFNRCISLIALAVKYLK